MLKTLSVLITGIITAIYTFVIVSSLPNNFWSSLLVALGVFVIVYTINKLEKVINSKRNSTD